MEYLLAEIPRCFLSLLIAAGAGMLNAERILSSRTRQGIFLGRLPGQENATAGCRKRLPGGMTS